jgi:SNF2 family DNA or RNA helicase
MPKFHLPDDLYPYQQEDAQKIKGEGNWLNFSEMGVGKTPETLEVIESDGYKLPLIVCPNSLMGEWKRQIEEWTNEESVLPSWNPYLKLEPIYRSFIEGQKYRIINYETLRKKENIELLQAIPWDIIIFDEIHKLRNPETKQVKGTWEFLNNLKRQAKIVGLSGSPIMNYPNDLYVPLSIINPDRWPRTTRNWKYFMYEYGYFSQGRFGTYMYASRNLDKLRRLVEPFTIRRLKKDVLSYLPDKYYKRVELDMPPAQRKLYDQMERELQILLDTGEPLWSPTFLATLTRLRQINLDPKILGVSSPSAKTEFIMDLVDSMEDKLVIFSCFERYIYLLSQIFLKEIPHVIVTGKVSNEERSRNVKRFQEDPNIKLFLGTIQTAGEGITLTASSNVIVTDRWWNEPTNQQAIDRLHRIGQTNAVQIIYPICTKSADEFLDRVLQRKFELSQDYYPESQIRDLVVSSLAGKEPT